MKPTRRMRSDRVPPRFSWFHHGIHHRLLTVKLRGRATTPASGRGPAISTGSRGRKPQAPHGPLQRLLGGGAQWLLFLVVQVPVLEVVLDAGDGEDDRNCKARAREEPVREW